MNPAHLHLILNHVPVVGTLFGLALLGWGLLRKSEELTKTSLGILIIIALLAIPVYLTGEPAEEIVEHLPGVNEASIEQHEEAALVAFVGILIVGAAALVSLVLFGRSKPVPNCLSVTGTGVVGNDFRANGKDCEPRRLDSTSRDSLRLPRRASE